MSRKKTGTFAANPDDEDDFQSSKGPRFRIRKAPEVLKRPKLGKRKKIETSDKSDSGSSKQVSTKCRGLQKTHTDFESASASSGPEIELERDRRHCSSRASSNDSVSTVSKYLKSGFEDLKSGETTQSEDVTDTGTCPESEDEAKVQPGKVLVEKLTGLSPEKSYVVQGKWILESNWLKNQTETTSDSHSQDDWSEIVGTSEATEEVTSDATVRVSDLTPESRDDMSTCESDITFKPRSDVRGVNPKEQEDHDLAKRIAQREDEELLEELLTEEAVLVCQICDKDISHMNTQRRMQHVNKCIDQEMALKEQKQAKDAAAQKLQNAVLPCPMCDAKFRQPQAKTSHMKSCAKKRKITIQELKVMLCKQDQEYMKNLTDGLIPIVPEKPKKKKDEVKKRAPKVIKEPTNKYEEDMQMTLALSRSLVEFKSDTMKPALPVAAQKTTKGKKNVPAKVPLLVARGSEERRKIIEEQVFALIQDDTSFPMLVELKPSKMINDDFDDTVQVVKGYLEGSLWAKMGTTSDEMLMEYYVKSLMPPISPCKVTMGSKIRRMSQVPGRNKSLASQVMVDLVEQTSPDKERTKMVSLDSSCLVDEDGLLNLSEGIQATGFCTIAQNEDSPARENSPTNGRNNHHETLIMDFKNMIGNPKLSDVSILCKDVEYVPAHKFVLAARCPELLEEIKREKIIEFDDVSRAAILVLLTYLYTGDVLDPDLEDEAILNDVASLSERFSLDGLLDECKQKGWSPAPSEDAAASALVTVDMEELLKSIWESDDDNDNSSDEERDNITMNEDDVQEIYQFMTQKNRANSQTNRTSVSVEEHGIVDYDVLFDNTGDMGESLVDLRHQPNVGVVSQDTINGVKSSLDDCDTVLERSENNQQLNDSDDSELCDAKRKSANVGHENTSSEKSSAMRSIDKSKSDQSLDGYEAATVRGNKKASEIGQAVGSDVETGKSGVSTVQVDEFLFEDHGSEMEDKGSVDLEIDEDIWCFTEESPSKEERLKLSQRTSAVVEGIGRNVTDRDDSSSGRGLDGNTFIDHVEKLASKPNGLKVREPNLGENSPCATRTYDSDIVSSEKENNKITTSELKGEQNSDDMLEDCRRPPGRVCEDEPSVCLAAKGPRTRDDISSVDDDLASRDSPSSDGDLERSIYELNQKLIEKCAQAKNNKIEHERMNIIQKSNMCKTDIGSGARMHEVKYKDNTNDHKIIQQAERLGTDEDVASDDGSFGFETEELEMGSSTFSKVTDEKGNKASRIMKDNSISTVADVLSHDRFKRADKKKHDIKIGAADVVKPRELRQGDQNECPALHASSGRPSPAVKERYESNDTKRSSPQISSASETLSEQLTAPDRNESENLRSLNRLGPKLSLEKLPKTFKSKCSSMVIGNDGSLRERNSSPKKMTQNPCSESEKRRVSKNLEVCQKEKNVSEMRNVDEGKVRNMEDGQHAFALPRSPLKSKARKLSKGIINDERIMKKSPDQRNPGSPVVKLRKLSPRSLNLSSCSEISRRDSDVMKCTPGRDSSSSWQQSSTPCTSTIQDYSKEDSLFLSPVHKDQRSTFQLVTPQTNSPKKKSQNEESPMQLKSQQKHSEGQTLVPEMATGQIVKTQTPPTFDIDTPNQSYVEGLSSVHLFDASADKFTHSPRFDKVYQSPMSKLGDARNYTNLSDSDEEGRTSSARLAPHLTVAESPTAHLQSDVIDVLPSSPLFLAAPKSGLCKSPRKKSTSLFTLLDSPKVHSYISPRQSPNFKRPSQHTPSPKKIDSSPISPKTRQILKRKRLQSNETDATRLKRRRDLGDGGTGKRTEKSDAELIRTKEIGPKGEGPSWKYPEAVETKRDCELRMNVRSPCRDGHDSHRDGHDSQLRLDQDRDLHHKSKRTREGTCNANLADRRRNADLQDEDMEIIDVDAVSSLNPKNQHAGASSKCQNEEGSSRQGHSPIRQEFVSPDSRRDQNWRKDAKECSKIEKQEKQHQAHEEMVESPSNSPVVVEILDSDEEIEHSDVCHRSGTHDDAFPLTDGGKEELLETFEKRERQDRSLKRNEFNDVSCNQSLNDVSRMNASPYDVSIPDAYDDNLPGGCPNSSGSSRRGDTFHNESIPDAYEDILVPSPRFGAPTPPSSQDSRHSGSTHNNSIPDAYDDVLEMSPRLSQPVPSSCRVLSPDMFDEEEDVITGAPEITVLSDDSDGQEPQNQIKATEKTKKRGSQPQSGEGHNDTLIAFMGDVSFEEEPAQRARVKTPAARKNWTAPSPYTPMPNYDTMATPQIKKELSRIGVRPQGKKKGIKLLKHVYEETHQYETDPDFTPAPNGSRKRQGTIIVKEKIRRVVTFQKDGDGDSDVEDDGLFSNIDVPLMSRLGMSPTSGRSRYARQNEARSSQVLHVKRRTGHDISDSDSDVSCSSDSSNSSGTVSDESLPDEGNLTSSQQETNQTMKEKILEFLRRDSDLYTMVLKYHPIEFGWLVNKLKEAGLACSANALRDIMDEQCIVYQAQRPARKSQKPRQRKTKKVMASSSPRKGPSPKKNAVPR